MYDEARERRHDPDNALAKVRIGRILQQQTVASIRTLESKISESGRGAKPAPHSIYNALRWLAGDTDQAVGSEPIVMRSNQPGLPCDMFYLSAADPEIVAQVLATKVRLEKTWHRFASRTGFDTIGQLGERIVRQAFEAAPDLFYVAPGWGDVKRVNGIDIPASSGPVGSVDGLVMLTSVPPAQGQAIIEVKNQREWLYPRDPDLWDIIRNGFAVGAVPVIFARKIYSSAFTYVLSRVGGIGIQMHAQFVPASAQTNLAMCKDRMGLGFKDLDFDETVPASLQKAIPIIAEQIIPSRRRMEVVRDIVTPHLDVLAADANRTVRNRHYYELQRALDNRFGVRE